MKYCFCLLLVTLALGSCRERDTAVGNDLGGLYKITDLTSDRALDLNNDGICSCDLYAEIMQPFHTGDAGSALVTCYDFDQRGNYAEVRPAFAGQTERRLILPNFPLQDIYYMDRTQPRLAFYGHDQGCYEYTLTPSSEVKLRLVNPETVRLGTIERLDRTGKDSFEIGMTGRLFDFATRQWTDVSLTVTYRRVDASDR